MPNRPFLNSVLFIAATCLFAFYLYTRMSVGPASAADGTGPNLVIQVDGSVQGTVVIDLLSEAAPKNVAQVVALAKAGQYNGVAFHRVIDGFMAQTGDVQYGRINGDLGQAGMGGSDLPNLPAEFSNIIFDRGIVGMARTNSPDSANSQFFIMFAPAIHLNGEYTVIGRVISGMDVVDKIKRGNPDLGGAVDNGPDWMAKVTVEE